MDWIIHIVNNETGRIVMKNEDDEELSLILPVTHKYKPSVEKINWIKEQTDLHEKTLTKKAFTITQKKEYEYQKLIKDTEAALKKISLHSILFVVVTIIIIGYIAFKEIL